MSTRSVALLILVAVLGLTVAPIASGAVIGTFTDDEAEESPANSSVSTFMQASAADTENTVESEMFGNKYNSSDNESRERLVLERADELVDRLETLEEERAELREDELHHGEYQARMTQFTVEIRALEREIDRTEHRANETGVDVDRLDELRTNAANLTGPEVAEIARGLAGNPPGHADGPPADRGSQSPPTDQGDRDPPTDRGDQEAGDQDTQGPPDERDEKSDADSSDDGGSSDEGTDADSDADRSQTDEGTGTDASSPSE